MDYTATPPGSGLPGADEIDSPSLLETERAAPACTAELVGRYENSGRSEPTFLARRTDGQWVELPLLLFLVLSLLDGLRSADEVATLVTPDIGRPVSSADVAYLLTTKLVPMGLAGSSPTAPARSDLALALRLRKTIVPAGAVRALARPLRFLFLPPLTLVFLAAFVAAEVFTYAFGGLNHVTTATIDHPADLLTMVGLLILSIPVHEMGHASACRYGGATPGRMGIGIYVTTPAFFTDLSDSYRLNRAGRVRADTGGVYFNGVFAAIVFAVYIATGYGVLLLVVAAQLIEVLAQLMPFVRFDGYWLLSDLVGVPDLFASMRTAFKGNTPLTPRARCTVRIWGVLTAVVLPVELTLLLLLLPVLASRAWNSTVSHIRELPSEPNVQQVLSMIGVVITAIFILALAYGLVYIARTLVEVVTKPMRGTRTCDRSRKARWTRGLAVVALLAAPVAWSANRVHWSPVTTSTTTQQEGYSP